MAGENSYYVFNSFNFENYNLYIFWKNNQQLKRINTDKSKFFRIFNK
jgi:hypothetical protein